ncbi:proton-conducting transporter membrane subunit [uncultured Thermanaerothrix sp.]|uniref:proton-conducting transporter transmembrane domain-containing protein n=1 Tax=uncultured Thermanaerothrix sp. TaxID=1195149 RepID=UPI00262BC840|nr:proton-conducting transporter membrane subunit [uncultured Thermanaerothrix sp.]
MSTAWLWIILPLISAIGLWFLRQHQRLTTGMSIGLCILLALAAAILPVGGTLRLGGWTLELSPVLTVLGRQLRLAGTDRPLLVLFYGSSALWFLGATRHNVSSFFIPHGLASLVLMIAALAVEPFIYSAPLIELAIIISIPALLPPNQASPRATLRFLTLQSLALPLLLIGGWVLGQVEGVPQKIETVLPAILMVGLGFALWLAVFPFHTWAIMLPQDNPLFPTGFFLSLVSTSSFLIVIDFFNSFPWIRTVAPVSAGLQLVGWLMVLLAGLWTFFVTDLRRVWGLGLIFDSGFGLIALSLGTFQGVTLFLETLPARILGLFLIAHCLANLQHSHNKILPLPPERLAPASWTSLGFLMGYSSLGGLPLLASFPARQGILFALAQQSSSAMIGALLGNLLFLINGIRLFSYALRPSEETVVSPSENPQTFDGLTLIAIIGLLGLGLLPGFFLQPAWQVARSFLNLAR